MSSYPKSGLINAFEREASQQVNYNKLRAFPGAAPNQTLLESSDPDSIRAILVYSPNRYTLQQGVRVLFEDNRMEGINTLEKNTILLNLLSNKSFALNPAHFIDSSMTRVDKILQEHSYASHCAELALLVLELSLREQLPEQLQSRVDQLGGSLNEIAAEKHKGNYRDDCGRRIPYGYLFSDYAHSDQPLYVDLISDASKEGLGYRLELASPKVKVAILESVLRNQKIVFEALRMHDSFVSHIDLFASILNSTDFPKEKKRALLDNHVLFSVKHASQSLVSSIEKTNPSDSNIPQEILTKLHV